MTEVEIEKMQKMQRVVDAVGAYLHAIDNAMCNRLSDECSDEDEAAAVKAMTLQEAKMIVEWSGYDGRGEAVVDAHDEIVIAHEDLVKR